MPITTRNLLENNFDPHDTCVDFSDFFSLVREKAMDAGWRQYVVNTITDKINDLKTITHLKFADIQFDNELIIFDRPLKEALYLESKMKTLLKNINDRIKTNTLEFTSADLARIDFANMHIKDIKKILMIFYDTLKNRANSTSSLNPENLFTIFPKIPMSRLGFTIYVDNKEYKDFIKNTFELDIKIETNSDNNKPRPSALQEWLMYFVISLRDFAVSAIKFITESFTTIGKSLYELMPNIYKSKYVGKIYKIDGEGEKAKSVPDTSVTSFYSGFDDKENQLSSQSKMQLPHGSAICNLLPETAKDKLGINYLIQASPADFSSDALITETDILNSVRNAVRLAKRNNVDHLLVTFVASTQFLLKRIKHDKEALKESKYVSQFSMNILVRNNFNRRSEDGQERYKNVMLQYLPQKIVETVHNEIKIGEHQIKSISYFDYCLYGEQNPICHPDFDYFLYGEQNPISFFNRVLQSTEKLENITELAYYNDPLVWLRTNQNHNEKKALIITRDAQLGADRALDNRNANIITGTMLDALKILGEKAYIEFEDNVAMRWKDIAITETEEQSNMIFSNTHKSIRTNKNAQMQKIAENNLSNSLKNSSYS